MINDQSPKNLIIKFVLSLVDLLEYRLEFNPLSWEWLTKSDESFQELWYDWQSLLRSCASLNFFEYGINDALLYFDIDLANARWRLKLISAHYIKSDLSESVKEGWDVVNWVFTFEKNFTDERKVRFCSAWYLTVTGEYNLARDFCTKLTVLQLQVFFDHFITNGGILLADSHQEVV